MRLKNRLAPLESRFSPCGEKRDLGAPGHPNYASWVPPFGVRRFPARLVSRKRLRLRSKHNLWMKQRAGYAGGDGDEVALAGEDFDLAGAGEVGEVDGAAAADAGGGGVVGGDRGEMRQELARVDEEGGYASVERKSRFLSGLGARFGMTRLYFFLYFPVGMTNLVLILDFFQGMGLGDIEFGDVGRA